MRVRAHVRTRVLVPDGARDVGARVRVSGRVMRRWFGRLGGAPCCVCSVKVPSPANSAQVEGASILSASTKEAERFQQRKQRDPNESAAVATAVLFAAALL